MTSDELLAKYGVRLNDVRDAADLQKEIYQIMLFDEHKSPEEAERLSWRLSEELWRAK